MSAVADQVEQGRPEWRAIIKMAALAIAATIALDLLLYASVDSLLGKFDLLADVAIFLYLASIPVLLIIAIIQIVQRRSARAVAPLIGLIVVVSFRAWQTAGYDLIDVARFHYGRNFYEEAVAEKGANGARGFVKFPWGGSGAFLSSSFHDLYYVKAGERLPAPAGNCHAFPLKITDGFYSVRTNC